jgi:hypothetical protein
MLEEIKREATPATFGFGISLDKKIEMPSIILKTPLENREKYVNADIDSGWGIMNDKGRVDLIYLDIIFKDVKKIRICFDETMFCTQLLHWFRLLIQTQGLLMLNDSLKLGEVEAIGVMGIPLDVPTIILKYGMGIAVTD